MAQLISSVGIFGVPVVVLIASLVFLVLFFCISKQEKILRKFFIIMFITLLAVACFMAGGIFAIIKMIENMPAIYFM